MQKRINAGWPERFLLKSGDRAILGPNSRPGPPQRIITIGDESHTMTEWARIIGISVSTLWRRIKLNRSPEAVLNRRYGKLVTIDGITDTVRGHAQRAGLKPYTLAVRLRQGWANADLLRVPSSSPRAGVNAWTTRRRRAGVSSPQRSPGRMPHHRPPTPPAAGRAGRTPRALPSDPLPAGCNRHQKARGR